MVEHSGTLELAALRLGEAPVVATTAVGQMVSSFTDPDGQSISHWLVYFSASLDRIVESF